MILNDVSSKDLRKFATILFDPLGLALELLDLVASECILVGTLTTEGLRVVGILRLFLNENVVLAILPVEEVSLITAHTHNRPVLLDDLLPPLLGFLTFLPVMSLLGGGRKFHLVWIDNFGFLL